jgi:hypothetical protein
MSDAVPPPKSVDRGGNGCGPLIFVPLMAIGTWQLLFGTIDGDSRGERMLATIQSVKVGGVPVLAIALSVYMLFNTWQFVRKKLGE